MAVLKSGNHVLPGNWNRAVNRENVIPVPVGRPALSPGIAGSFRAFSLLPPDCLGPFRPAPNLFLHDHRLNPDKRRFVITFFIPRSNTSLILCFLEK
jgi:hypothetical protein